MSEVRFRVVPDEQAVKDWDAWLSAFKDRHIKQGWTWGRLKRSSWKALPTVLFNGPTPMAMSLVLLRQAPLGAGTLAWVNGGPAFQKPRPRAQDMAYLKDYLKGLQDHLKNYPRPVLRLSLQIPMDLEAQVVLRQAGFVRPLMPLTTSLTYVVDLTKSLDELRAGLERNWRHQLKQAEKAAPEIATGRERALLERYLPLNDALVEQKGLHAQKMRLEELEETARNLGENITFFIVSAKGRDGCGGALWTLGDKAWFALSAANEWGLKHNLPNAMFWHAISSSKSSGAASLDLAGVDPRNGWGVLNFKRGLNATLVETLGEWDWSPSDWTRRAFNLALWGLRDSLPA